VRASPASYTLSLLRAQIIRDLELGRHGLHVQAHEPYLFAPLPDGRKVVTWSDPRRTRDQLAQDWSQADADAYSEWAARWERAAERARPLMLEPYDHARWMDAVGEGILTGPVADELAGIPSEEVRMPFALQGSIGTLAGPYDPGTAFIAFYHDLGEAVPGRPGAWGFARGGQGGVTDALRSSAEAAGARIHLDAEVEGVLIADGEAGGIRLAGGREVRSRVVLSNADPVRTAALAHVDPPAGWRQDGPVVKVMLLLDGLPDFPSWPGEEPWHGAIDIGFSLDDLQRAADDARAGRPAAAPWIEAACQTSADPTLAPPGKHVASLFCQSFPVDVDADAAADAAVARFAEVCPGLPDRIVDRLVLGPKQLEERFGLTGGHIFHGEMLPGIERPGPRRFGGVDGLYLAGSGAHPGGAVSGAPGYLAAQAVLEDLRQAS
jgi:phytoene dehydrogenase-like protein